MAVTVSFLSSTVTLLAPNESRPEEESGTGSKKLVMPVVVSSAIVLFFLVMGIICWKFFFQDKYKRERGTFKSTIWALINGHRNALTVASGGGVGAPKPELQDDLMGLDLKTGSFTLRQLGAATNNFDSANKIGEGGFGSVYKGELSDGTAIAVKQLSPKSTQGNREFVNEIGMISGLKHPNLVKLCGCCIEGDQLLLVYEYMENNCLARALFGAETSALMLDWPTRFKICVGIARGLAFLHEGSAIRIVHRDIKGTNVLLDKDLNAKISDFGLAKLNEAENTHISTRVAGTIGYMAPEYALWGYLSDKADVYSFGVVALEIVSGRSNSSYNPTNESVCLLDWAFVLQKRGNLMALVDPKLRSEFNKEEAEKMIKVALLCANASPSLRPSMPAVVSMLEGQTSIQEVISDPTIYGGGSQFKQVNYDHFQQVLDQSCSTQDHVFSSDKTWNVSTSMSAHDLYPPSP
ncbi:probable LRR receptor-like serine/threonine-protein kinase At1g07650 isoform X3 [Populus trichocarpa]|uniref:probable LRR receptor-like serine/threonine-protein kinase At1g07650 isoform X3 n=1 Tax=Populus trichocarpa TaxID=3694 RepID=UPI0022777F05|nr:probable LRR receptor-like serine/threonine-protein kinase At1g07650 isoform X3 [Populus trichocarpa]